MHAASEHTAADRRAEISGVLGRLLHAPRARPEEATARLALVERLLRSGGGWWRAEDLAEQPDELPALRTQLKELRRIGLLRWDEDHGGYALGDELRVPVALTLLACAPQAPDTDQLKLLDLLVPFAQLATRGDLRGAPAWAMLDLLERDVRAMEDALAAGPDRLAELAADRWLIRSAADMQRTVSRLQALEGADVPGVRQLITRAVELLGIAGEQIARLSVRMSRSTRDRLRLPGSRRSAAELRAAALRLDSDELALTLAGSAALAPTVLRLPDEDELAAVAPAELGQLDAAQRAFPDHDDLLAAEPPPSEPPEPDARQLALGRLEHAPPRRMAEHLFAPLEDWQAAVRLQHGLVRIQGEAARRGVPGWLAVPERIELPPGSPVSWLWEIERGA